MRMSSNRVPSRSAVVAAAIVIAVVIAFLAFTLTAKAKPDSEDARYLSPREMALSPDGRRLYVMCEASDEVRVVDTSSGKVVQVVAVGHIPRGISLSPDGQQILFMRGTAATYQLYTIHKDGSNLQQITNIPLLRGRSVAAVDDSIVRGTTSRKLVDLLFKAGASEVHFRVASPPITHPCHYGIDTPTRAELIANQHDVEGIRRFIGATTLGFLAREDLETSVKKPADYCYACWTGRYPTHVPENGNSVPFDND